MRIRGALLAGLATIALLVAASGACRAPTQMTIQVQTEGALSCSDLDGVLIFVGPTPEETESRAASRFVSAQSSGCHDMNSVGTLVITPEGSHGAVVVVAPLKALVDPAKPCAPPDYAGCIVSRRSFGFIDHVSEVLPITLQKECHDVACDALRSCRRGTCRSSAVTCDDNGACTSDAEGTDGPLGDGGSEATSNTDANAIDGAPIDAGADGDIGPSGGPYGCPTKADMLCDANQNCCKMVTPGPWSCNRICPPGFASFDCTDRTRCQANQLCCYSMPGAAMYRTICQTTCNTSAGELIICQQDTDCPGDMHCNSPGPVVGDTTSLKHCAP